MNLNLPNQLSLLRIVLTPVFVMMLFFDNPWVKTGSFIVFAIASITDYYDGYAARKYGIVTMWGQFLDPLADKILVSSGLICFSVLGFIPGWMVLTIVVRDFLITALRSYAIVKGKPIRTNFFAKAKTTGQLFMIVSIYLFHLFTWYKEPERFGPISRLVFAYDIIVILMFIITLITVISGVIYIVNNWSHIQMLGQDIARPFKKQKA